MPKPPCPTLLSTMYCPMALSLPVAPPPFTVATPCELALFSLFNPTASDYEAN